MVTERTPEAEKQHQEFLARCRDGLERLLSEEEIRSNPHYKLTPPEALPYSILIMQDSKTLEQERKRVLAIINDWDAMADPDYEGDGEAEFLKKYGRDTTELVQVIQEALEGK